MLPCSSSGIRSSSRWWRRSFAAREPRTGLAVRYAVQAACTSEAIRRHYDVVSPLYQRLWGEHIHHGFFENGETPSRAQVKLIERLAARAGVPRGARVLDVGCGLGASARWLAGEYDCRVLGITLSPVQVRLARAAAGPLAPRVSFRVADAERWTPPSEAFDVVWVVECSEHLRDKAGFMAKCARALAPGGKLALCAWLAAGSTPAQAELVREIETAMLCPSLASLSDYTRWMDEAGLGDISAEDITTRVAQTWTHCLPLLRTRPAQWLLRAGGGDIQRFAAGFSKMARAYTEGALAYGMFLAARPASS